MKDDANGVSAAAIAQNLLERSGDALFRGDFEGLAKCFALPLSLTTLDGQRSVDTLQDLQGISDAIRAHLASAGITMMHRRCVSGSFRGPDEIVSTHETRLLRGDILMHQPFPALSTLTRHHGHWQVSATEYAIPDNPAYNRALTG